MDEHSRSMCGVRQCDGQSRYGQSVQTEYVFELTQSAARLQMSCVVLCVHIH